MADTWGTAEIALRDECGDDDMAVSVLQVLRQRGWHAPSEYVTIGWTGRRGPSGMAPHLLHMDPSDESDLRAFVIDNGLVRGERPSEGVIRPLSQWGTRVRTWYRRGRRAFDRFRFNHATEMFDAPPVVVAAPLPVETEQHCPHRVLVGHFCPDCGTTVDGEATFAFGAGPVSSVDSKVPFSQWVARVRSMYLLPPFGECKTEFWRGYSVCLQDVENFTGKESGR